MGRKLIKKRNGHRSSKNYLVKTARPKARRPKEEKISISFRNPGERRAAADERERKKKI